MSQPFVNYSVAIGSLLAVATLVVTQVAIATAVTRRAGHVPGTALTLPTTSFAFRAFRAHQNSLENVPLFAIALVAALFAGASPSVVTAAATVFAASRFAHAAAYYAGIERIRTTAFAVGLVSIVATLFVTAQTLAARVFI